MKLSLRLRRVFINPTTVVRRSGFPPRDVGTRAGADDSPTSKENTPAIKKRTFKAMTQGLHFIAASRVFLRYLPGTRGKRVLLDPRHLSRPDERGAHAFSNFIRGAAAEAAEATGAKA